MQEFLATIIGEEAARVIAEEFRGDYTGLYRAEKEQLMEIEGIDEATADKIRAVINFSEALYTGHVKEEAARVNNVEAAFKYITARLSHKEEEHFMVLLLDEDYHIVDEDIISKNSSTETTCEPRQLFKKAIRKGVKNIILAHNHPNGDMRASKNDILTTQKLLKIGLFLGINIKDHIIIGNGEYLSMRDDGCLDFKKVLEETKDITF